eukprot:FR738739.1.p1 GENE.FR738739.1~~FR738739.1.p1  ORF type:complete len:178 (+),score=2.66 FR738739.1:121-654(+)
MRRTRIAFLALGTAAMIVNAKTVSPHRKTETGAQKYPQDSLKCVSTNTRGENNRRDGDVNTNSLICPQYANNYCIKEQSTPKTEASCSKGLYWSDKWTDDGKCITRRCGDKCEDGVKVVYYDTMTAGGRSEVDSEIREQWCCNTDYCNSGMSTRLSRPLLLVAVVFTVGLLMREAWG